MRNDYLKISKARCYDYLLQGFGTGVDVSLGEEVLPVLVASECYNFDFSDGTLKEGYGLDNCFITREDISAVWIYSKYNFSAEKREEIVMFATAGGEVFYFPPLNEAGIPTGGYIRLDGVRLNSAPRAVNYRLYGEDVILLCTDKDPMVVWDGVNPAYTVVSSPLITSLAMHFERMFVTIAGQKNAVWFSDDLDPTNWSLDLQEGGFIEMMDERGALNKVISYLNYIYIFRDYGISRLTAYSDQVDFSVSNLFVSSGKIYPETVCLCGDRVIFFADDGLYAFDGLSTIKVLKRISGLFEAGNNAAAAFVSGKYYLAVRIKTKENDIVGEENGSYKNNGLLVYDVAAGTYSLSRGFDIRRICACAGEPFAVLDGGKICKIVKNGKLFGQSLKKKWRVPKTDFGSPDKLKHIKNLYISTKYDIDITLYTDIEEKTVRVRGRSSPQRVLVEARGTRIGADIVSYTAKAEISRPLLKVAKT